MASFINWPRSLSEQDLITSTNSECAAAPFAGATGSADLPWEAAALEAAKAAGLDEGTGGAGGLGREAEEQLCAAIAR